MSAKLLIKKPNSAKKNKVDDVWDYIIIGAGITGLYAAYRLRQHTTPSTQILVLEAGCRVGGRMAMVDFHGINIEPGAGIGRLEKDKALIGLLEELGIKWSKFPVSHNYSPVAYNSQLAYNNSNQKGIKRLPKIGRVAQKIQLPQPTPNLTTPDWIKKQVNKLRATYKKTPAITTFHAFALKVLGRKVYQQLVLALGYTDFEKEDVAETLFNYGLDDLYDHWTGMGIDWQELMDNLVKHSRATIKLNTRAVKLNHDDTGMFTIQTSSVPIETTPTSSRTSLGDKLNTMKLRNSNKYSSQLNSMKTQKHKRFGLTRQNIPNLPTSNSIGCHQRSKLKNTSKMQEFRARKVLIATTITPARELVSDFMLGLGLRIPIHLSGVQSQSFLRIYGYFTGKNHEVMQKYCQHTQVVPGGYHRIIPMGSSDGGKSGVYMIVYTDNRAADNLEHLKTNTPANRQILADGIKAALGIPNDTSLDINDILGYYWREGTHYYTPLNQRKFGTRDEFLKQLQHPIGTHGGLFLAGEAFSRQQGWTEGAIESVDAVLGDML